MNVRFVCLGACALVLAAAPAFAQQPGTVAVVASSSGLGVQFKAGERLALRPEFSFSVGSTETTASAITAKADSSTVGLGLSAPIYLHRQDRFGAYVSPQFTRLRSKTSLGTVDDPAQSQYSVAGSFGADYRVGDRFMVFGELGLAYRWQSIESTALSTTAVKTHATGTRSVVGVGIFF